MVTTIHCYLLSAMSHRSFRQCNARYHALAKQALVRVWWEKLGAIQKWMLYNGQSYENGWFGVPPHFSKPLCPCWLVRIGDCNILQPGFLGIITTHHGEYGFLGILTTHHGEDMLTRFLVDMLTTIYHPSWGMLSNQFFSPCGMTGSLPGSIQRSL